MSLSAVCRQLKKRVWALTLGLAAMALLAGCGLFNGEDDAQPATMMTPTHAGPALRVWIPDDVTPSEPAETGLETPSTSPSTASYQPADGTIIPTEATIAVELLPTQATQDLPAGVEKKDSLSTSTPITPTVQEAGIPTATVAPDVMEHDPDLSEAAAETAAETKSAAGTPESIALQTATIAPTLTVDPAGPYFSQCVSRTGGNATFGVPTGMIFEGPFQLQKGDEIAIFSSDGAVCGGSAVWDGSSLAITVWSDDPQTEERDGLAPGDPMQFRIWDVSGHFEYDDIEALFAAGGGGFIVNGIFAVTTMKVNAP